MTTVITTVPSRDRPTTFASDANAAWDALATLSQEIATYSASLDAAVTTVMTAISAALWVSGTSYVVGDIRRSPATGLIYLRRTNGAGTTDPSADATNWEMLSVAAPTLVVVSTTTATATRNSHVEMTNSAASTLTLPASPAVGDWVWVGFTNTRVDNVIARNGQNIAGVAEDLTVNWPMAGFILRYISAGYGWRIFK